MENSFINFERKRSFLRQPINFKLAVLIILLLSGTLVWQVLSRTAEVPTATNTRVLIVHRAVPKVPEKVKKEEWRFAPGPISMEDVKKKGCVADGLLSGYGGDINETVKLIDRSECVYLHRALETWLSHPDFDKAREIMQKVKKRPVVFGMFLAEAVTMSQEYDDPLSDHTFRFSKMCRDGTENQWGNNTCVPSLSKDEYRRYLRTVTHEAIDLGIQSFLFGQMLLQDEQPNFENSEIKKVIDNMRQYAQKKGVQIIIGAQTDSITDEKYLRLFDYIEGGVGMGPDGKIEAGPCWSRMSNCWALLWNERYESRANNVLLHLDWSGLAWDDMGVFTKMDHETRIETLKNLYQYFTSRKMGFLMPFLAVIGHENGGCYGPNKNFYTPDNKYRCHDENDIKKIMKGN